MHEKSPERRGARTPMVSLATVHVPDGRRAAASGHPLIPASQSMHGMGCCRMPLLLLLLFLLLLPSS